MCDHQQDTQLPDVIVSSAANGDNYSTSLIGRKLWRNMLICVKHLGLNIRYKLLSASYLEKGLMYKCYVNVLFIITVIRLKGTPDALCKAPAFNVLHVKQSWLTSFIPTRALSFLHSSACVKGSADHAGPTGGGGLALLSSSTRLWAQAEQQQHLGELLVTLNPRSSESGV